jgi:hypothetical protein
MISRVPFKEASWAQKAPHAIENRMPKKENGSKKQGWGDCGFSGSITSIKERE